MSSDRSQYALCVVGNVFYVRRGPHHRRSRRFCDHVVIVRDPWWNGENWKVRVRVIAPRETYDGSPVKRDVGHEYDISCSRLVPIIELAHLKESS